MKKISKTQEKFFQLLPSIYRQGDQESGGALRALLAVLEREMQVVEEDIATLYDNWFVDTCQEWALPYIGDLLGAPELSGDIKHIAHYRRFIANAIRYRRRKGVASVLENVVYDMTGWAARPVEFFQQLSQTQSIYNLKKERGRILDFRDPLALEQLSGPFASSAHLLDVRSIESGAKGKYHPFHVGIFLWRLRSYSSPKRTAHFASDAPGCFFFHPLGKDLALFNRGQANSDLSALSENASLAVPLTRNLFRKDLEEQQKQEGADCAYYGPGRSFSISVKGEPLLPEKIMSADLSQWNQGLFSDPSATAEHQERFEVAVDVERGRIMFSPTFLQTIPLQKGDVVVDFHYGFSADIGGGPYQRTLEVIGPTPSLLELTVSQEGNLKTLDHAFRLWNQHCVEQIPMGNPVRGVIRIADNGVYEGEQDLNLPENTQLIIEAMPGKNPFLNPTRPMTVSGPEEEGKIADFSLNGIQMNKSLRLQGGIRLKVRHCSLMPSQENNSNREGCRGIIVEEKAHDLEIKISDSIVGSLAIPEETTLALEICDSIVDENTTGDALFSGKDDKREGPATTLERVTLFGRVCLRELAASETIFCDPVLVKLTQTGLVRFCYVPPRSHVPVRYHCYPKEQNAPQVNRFRPHFTSVRYGDPGYAQLSPRCPIEIREGASDGGEIGAFQQLYQPQKEENLKKIVAEYLRQDLTAGFFYVT